MSELNWTELNAWCDELRTTHHVQAKGTLDDGWNGRCCLGVKIQLMAHCSPGDWFGVYWNRENVKEGKYPELVTTSDLPAELASGMTEQQTHLLGAFNDGGPVGIDYIPFAGNPYNQQLSFREIADVVQMFFGDQQ